MALITSLIVFAVLCASALADMVTTGYITRVDFVDAGCTNPFRNTTFLINVCAPPAPVMYQYDDSSLTITQSYFQGDAACTQSMAQSGTFQAGDCITSPISPYIFYYSASFPELLNGVYTYTVFNPASADCSGEVYSVKQELDVCYPNQYSGYMSTMLSCSGTTLSTLSCTDLNCTTACTTATSSADPSRCDSPNHAISSCNAPQTTAGGATVATTGKSTSTATGAASATAKGTTATGSATGTTGSGSASASATAGSGSASVDTTGATTSSAPAVVASVVLASASVMLLL